ncbi:MAG: hypothetical protein HYV60_23355 [Planctomycetia bacterium]|nr:hypothetical protein [Planctomycetia bacterium]
MTSKQLYELIDACRPGRDDVDQPEFSELATALSQDPHLREVFARSQEVDSMIRTTFQAVTPRPGFAERLLESLETATIEDIEVSQGVITRAEPSVELARRSARRSFSMMAGVASICAVAAAITIWLAMPQPISTPSDHAIAESVDRWNTELDKKADWQTVTNLPTQDFPTWQHLEISRGDRWQWVSKRRTVCYDLVIRPRENGEIVRLFVSKPTSAVSLPAIPPAGYPSPAGWLVGAWQSNGRVYYLAVYANRDIKSLYSRVIGSRISPA